MRETLLTLLPLIPAVLVSWIGGRWSIRSKRVEVEASPYEQLADRVTALERQVGILLTDQWRDREWIRGTIAWAIREKLSLPFPLPEWWTDENPEHAITTE